MGQGRAHTEINDELGDLEAGDPLLPPDANATRTLEVVPVHDDMDGQVERDRDPRNSRRANELGVAEEGSGAVVVAVKEGCEKIQGQSVAPGMGMFEARKRTERLLLQEQEAGIQELEVFGQVVQLEGVSAWRRGTGKSRREPT